MTYTFMVYLTSWLATWAPPGWGTPSLPACLPSPACCIKQGSSEAAAHLRCGASLAWEATHHQHVINITHMACNLHTHTVKHNMTCLDHKRQEEEEGLETKTGWVETCLRHHHVPLYHGFPKLLFSLSFLLKGCLPCLSLST